MPKTRHVPLKPDAITPKSLSPFRKVDPAIVFPEFVFELHKTVAYEPIAPNAIDAVAVATWVVVTFETFVALDTL